MSKLSETRRRIASLGMADAQEELRALRSQLFHLRLQHARGEVKNNRQFQQIRADIARLMFRLSELNREAMLAPEDADEDADEGADKDADKDADNDGETPELPAGGSVGPAKSQ